MPRETQSLAQIYAELRRRANVNPQGNTATISFTNLRQYSKRLGFIVRKVLTIARGPAYYIVADEKLLNPNFDTDLTSWTESTDGAGITATSTRSNTEQHASQLHHASLKLNVTDSIAGNTNFRRSQVITGVSPGQIWSVEAWTLPTALLSANILGRVTVEFRDGASSVLASYDVDFTTVITDGTWQQASILNKTAPALTVDIRVSLIIRTLAASQTGTIYYGGVKAVLEPNIIAFATRGIVDYSKAS